MIDYVSRPLILSYLISLVALTLASAAYATERKCEDSSSYYVFSWPISEGCYGLPRGGNSKGADVEISRQVHKGWEQIQDPKNSSFERDRSAILAMAGGYKVEFNFIETVGFSANFKRDKPYHSWGTEYVYVIEDESDFISLQHLMVMYFKQDDGSISEATVMKHWRQDWTYQDSSLLEYHHKNTWVNRQLDAKKVKGKWSQAVFQVDDSPRYESIGRWVHNPSFSTWLSATTRRPMPRREYSVRKDYDVLEGFNRHTVTRHGWVQEEENWKLSLDDKGDPNADYPYLAKEQGVARYQLVSNIDFTPGDLYMQKTAAFWKAVRRQWRVVINANHKLSLKPTVDGQPLFITLFSAAETDHNTDDMSALINATISKYVN
ncbi:MAG: hypothetical protein ACI854_000754 [Arenicella sp.]|jgi:hypothetical protein